MSSQTSKPTWLITGCSSGIGFALAVVALKAGHNVIASSRNPSKSPDFVKQIESYSNGRWMTLDITAPDLKGKVIEAEKYFGGIDVLVNNAAYAILGTLEDIPEAQARAQMDTNFFGPLRLIQAVLPGMRARGQAGRSQTIVNMSSIAGHTAVATSGLYAASKHAIEAISQSLSQEVADFGIRVLLVEPGAIRTQFLTSTNSNVIELSKPYHSGAVRQALDHFHALDGKQGGSADKVAQAIFDTATETGRAQDKRKVLRLFQGKDCHARMRTQMQSVIDDLEEMEDLDVALD